MTMARHAVGSEELFGAHWSGACARIRASAAKGRGVWIPDYFNLKPYCDSVGHVPPTCPRAGPWGLGTLAQDTMHAV